MKIFVDDAGEFGTAIAVILARAGHEVTLRIPTFDYPHVEMLRSLQQTGKNAKGKRENDLYFEGVELPQNMDFADGLEAIVTSDVVLLSRPSKYIYESFIAICERLKQTPGITLVLLAKGFAHKSLLPLGVEMDHYLRAAGLNNFAVISGPTPALELVDPDRTFVASAASEDRNVTKKLKKMCQGSGLYLVETKDIVGVSWGGCLKNSYAIGYGILGGLAAQARKKKEDTNFSVSATQYLFCIGWHYLDVALQEMKVFLADAGAKPRTINSPAVKGDFRMTCEGTVRWKSRNVRFGEFLAEYHKKADIDDYVSNNTVEGYEAMKALYHVAQSKELDAPLLYGIHSICEFGASPATFIALVESRSRKGDKDNFSCEV